MPKRRKHGNSVSEGDTYLQAGLAAGYVCNNTEKELDSIAAASGGIVTAAHLAERVGRFLLSHSRRSLLHGAQPMPSLRTSSTEGHEEFPAETVPHVHSRGGRPSLRRITAKGLAAIRRAQKKRWAKAKKVSRYGWSDDPEERKKEGQRRMAVRRVKEAAKAAKAAAKAAKAA
jgi:hypothetical protein